VSLSTHCCILLKKMFVSSWHISIKCVVCCCFIVDDTTCAALSTLLLSVSGTIRLMSADSYCTFHASGRLTHSIPKRTNSCHTHRHLYYPFILNLHCMKYFICLNCLAQKSQLYSTCCILKMLYSIFLQFWFFVKSTFSKKMLISFFFSFFTD